MSSKSRDDDILAQFPGPVILYPSRSKWLLVLIGFLIFFWIISGTGGLGRGLIFFVGGLIFCGLGAIVAAVMLIPGAGWLRLDRDGFETTSLFWYHRRARWQDVSEFDVLALRDTIKVVYKHKGRNASLPDTYGLSAGNLLVMMTHWRERALSQAFAIDVGDLQR
jgi:hypothetical protein